MSQNCKGLQTFCSVVADADVKEPTWMTQWRRYPVIWISSYIDIDISRYRYIQQSCCVILFVIEMCVDHWWRESQNQPNTNNWQVIHCGLNASWESSQRSQKRKHHDHLMMSSLEYWYGLKNLLKNHSFIQSDFSWYLFWPSALTRLEAGPGWGSRNLHLPS